MRDRFRLVVQSFQVARTRKAPEGHRKAWGCRMPLLRAALRGRDAGPNRDRNRDRDRDQSQPGMGSSRHDLRTELDLRAALLDIIDPQDRSQVWLALAVLTGRLPDRTTVVEVARASEFDSGASLSRAVRDLTTDESAGWQIRVATDEVLIDVAHTTSQNLITGIQRVARETTRRWLRDHDCTPISWTRDFQSLRELTVPERSLIVQNRVAPNRVVQNRVVKEQAEGDIDSHPDETRLDETHLDETHLDATVVIPWHATYLLPELAAEPERSARLLALAELTPNRTGVIGFDCVPITSADTTQLGFAAVFAGNLAAVRSFDVVATISRAAGGEYSGWRSMLSAIGVPGPRIEPVQLPVEVAESTIADMKAAATRFLVGRLPLVLVVGSQEPRKNHLAVLHAAELLWREGVQFSLSFVGGYSWDNDSFSRRLAELQRAGRPVDSAGKLSDGQLWATYRLARCTVFPSLNEGFGLPVAESLAAGTPAITSDFGSMLEIAADGGALTVDPHDDHAIAAAIGTLLADDVVHDRLSAGALNRPIRTWDDYAGEVWDLLVES